MCSTGPQGRRTVRQGIVVDPDTLSPQRATGGGIVMDPEAKHAGTLPHLRVRAGPSGTGSDMSDAATVDARPVHGHDPHPWVRDLRTWIRQMRTWVRNRDKRHGFNAVTRL